MADVRTRICGRVDESILRRSRGRSPYFAMSSLFLKAPFTRVTLPCSSNSVQRSWSSFRGFRRVGEALSSRRLGGPPEEGRSLGWRGPADRWRIFCHDRKACRAFVVVEKAVLLLFVLGECVMLFLVSSVFAAVGRRGGDRYWVLALFLSYAFPTFPLRCLTSRFQHVVVDAALHVFCEARKESESAWIRKKLRTAGEGTGAQTRPTIFISCLVEMCV